MALMNKARTPCVWWGLQQRNQNCYAFAMFSAELQSHSMTTVWVKTAENAKLLSPIGEFYISLWGIQSYNEKLSNETKLQFKVKNSKRRSEFQTEGWSLKFCWQSNWKSLHVCRVLIAREAFASFFSVCICSGSRIKLSVIAALALLSCWLLPHPKVVSNIFQKMTFSFEEGEKREERRRRSNQSVKWFSISSLAQFMRASEADRPRAMHLWSQVSLGWSRRQILIIKVPTVDEIESNEHNFFICCSPLAVALSHVFLPLLLSFLLGWETIMTCKPANKRRLAL